MRADPSSYDPISFTARKILEKRAQCTHIPYSREVADAAGVQWRVSRVRAWARHLVWGRIRAGNYLQFRHDAISGALAGMKAAPVLEIGSGFSPRGITEAALREVYVESDLPRVIETKRRIVRSVLPGGVRANHHFVSFNACSPEETERMAAYVRALELERSLAVVNEGILMYLASDEQRAFRDNVRDILARCSPRGAWITTDFSERDYEDTLLQRLMTRRLARTVERRFNRFESDDAVVAFLSEAGLVGEKLTAPVPAGADREVREVVESFRAWRIVIGTR